MKLFLDCEFNGFGGDLISMALVSTAGHEWYQTLPCNNPDPWVAEHVFPVLEKVPTENMTMEILQKDLEEFLCQFPSVHIVADWPDDISYFCKAMLTGPGTRIDTPPITFEVVRFDAPSEMPHNALADARGIAKFLKESSHG